VLRTLGEIYVSLAPPILAGILNMAWVKKPVLRRLARPIDDGRTMRDGRRIFGDNKTWKGLLGMVVLSALAGLALGALERGTAAETLNLFYRDHLNTHAWSSLVGTLLGLGYTLAELPNSFLKRRLGISPGRPPAGAAKVAFILGDQADSVLGCAIILALVVGISAALFGAIIVVGAVTHLVLNLALYAFHLRRNPF